MTLHWSHMLPGERVEEIRRLDAAGMSQLEIADELDTTRNAVASFAYHHKMLLVSSARRVMRTAPMVAAEDVNPEAWRPIEGSTPKSFMDVVEGEECMWSVIVDGKDLFCAQPIHKKRYCEHHSNRATTKQEPRHIAVPIEGKPSFVGFADSGHKRTKAGRKKGAE